LRRNKITVCVKNILRINLCFVNEKANSRKQFWFRLFAFFLLLDDLTIF